MKSLASRTQNDKTSEYLRSLRERILVSHAHINEMECLFERIQPNTKLDCWKFIVKDTFELHPSGIHSCFILDRGALLKRPFSLNEANMQTPKCFDKNKFVNKVRDRVKTFVSTSHRGEWISKAFYIMDKSKNSKFMTTCNLCLFSRGLGNCWCFIELVRRTRDIMVPEVRGIFEVR